FGMWRIMVTLTRSRGQYVLDTNELSAIEKLITPIEVFEAIAGEFPDEDETPDIQEIGEGRWRVDGGADLLHLELLLNTDGLATEDDDYSTMAGFMLERFGKLPEVGARCEHNDGNAVFTFTVERMEGRRIATVLIERHPAANSETEETR